MANSDGKFGNSCVIYVPYGMVKAYIFIKWRDNKHMKLKIKTGAAVLAGIFILLAGCTEREESIKKGKLTQLNEESKEDTVELSVLYTGENIGWIAAMEELCESFMSDYPNIRVVTEHSNNGSYTEQLKAKEAIGEFPDIFEIEDPYMFQEADKLGIISSEIGDLVKSPIQIGKEVYTLPFYDTSIGIIYNKVLFKKYGLSVPSTYDEFLTVCEQLLQNGVAPLAAGGSHSDTNSNWLNYFFLTMVESENPGWQQKRKKSKVSFQDADMQEALKSYQELMRSPYILEDSINMNDNQIIVQLLNQKVAMFLAEPGMFTEILESYPMASESDKTPLGEELEDDPVMFRMGWFYMPDQHGEKVVIHKSGSQLAISQECAADRRKRKAAEQFLAFSYQKENYRRLLQAMYAMPTTKDAVLYAAPIVQQDLLTSYRYADKIETYFGNYETPENFTGDMESILYSLATNTIHVETAAERLDQSWDDARTVQ